MNTSYFDLIGDNKTASIFMFQGVANVYLSDDLPFKNKIQEIMETELINYSPKYHKYFDIQIIPTEVQSGPHDMKEEAMFIVVKFKNEYEMIDDACNYAQNKNLPEGKLIDFLKTIEDEIQTMLHAFYDKTKKEICKVLREFTDENQYIVLSDKVMDFKPLFAERFIENATDIYPEYIDNEFNDLERSYGFSRGMFMTDHEYRMRWKKALGINAIYGESLELQKLNAHGGYLIKDYEIPKTFNTC